MDVITVLGLDLGSATITVVAVDSADSQTLGWFLLIPSTSPGLLFKRDLEGIRQ